MNAIKKFFVFIKDGIGLLVKLIGAYIGVVSSVIGTILGIMASALVLLVIAGICLYVKVLPDFTEARTEAFDKMANMSADDFIRTEDTMIYDAKGKRVGSVNTGKYHYITIDKISPYLYNGYIAVEDKRFKTHAGVDMLATMRAGVALLKNNMSITQGGSTITQQVVKNNLLSQEQTYTRKIAEILLAPAVEERFSKDKIMEFYCNSNFYGNHCYGVEAASRYYFGKSCDALEPYEAAILIGLSNNPSKYDPILHPETSLEKRNRILDTMYAEGVITEKEYKVSKEAELKILKVDEKKTGENYIMSYAIHCGALALMEKEGFTFQYTFTSKEDYQKYKKRYSTLYARKSNEIRAGGYKLYTSLDSSLQKKLQKALDQGLSFNKQKDKKTKKYALQGAAACVDNESNYVVAIVGGRGTKDQYNRAYLSYRQSGSSIKPLLDYAPGIEAGAYLPSTLMDDHKIKNGPKNSGNSYRGKVRIREAVARSINTIAWQVLEKITPEYGLGFLDKMHFMGLSYVDNENLAISLGGFTEGIRVVDMAKGYSTLANEGKYSDRTCIRKIEHGSDGTVYQNANEVTEVYSKDTAWLMTDVLKGVFTESYGTGHRLKLEKKQICAGKTGTANSGKDVWFCGYTKYYTTVVWAGYDTPKPMPGATGASVTGGIWKSFMDELHKELTPEDFEVPNTICLAAYRPDGSMIEGTEEEGTKKRAKGKDYFSTELSEKEETFTTEQKEQSYEKKVLKSLKSFEKMKVEALADYYEFREAYLKLRKQISGIEDDTIRERYATRAKNKYDSYVSADMNWDAVADAYVEAKKAEEELEARENEEKAYEERQRAIKKSRLRVARAKIKRLKAYHIRPDNADVLIAEAETALNKCRKYTEYTSLKELFDKNVLYIRGLPTKEEYEAAQNEEDFEEEE